MSSTEQLYVSVHKGEYAKGKATILQSEASILKILKHYQALQLLWKEKKLLRSKLNKVFTTAIKNIDEASNQMPMPKAVLKRIEQDKKEREEKKKQQQEKQKKQAQQQKRKQNPAKKKDSIDEELASIQEKLNALTR